MVTTAGIDNPANSIKRDAANSAYANSAYAGGAVLRAVEQQACDPQLVRDMIAQGADVNVRHRKFKTTPIVCAAIYGHLEVLGLLIDAGARVQTMDKDGLTALHWAAREGHDDIARLLMARKADINARDYAERSPLHWAAQCDSRSAVRLLLDHGALFDGADKKGHTPYDIARDMNRPHIRAMLLQEPARRIAESRKKALSHSGGDVLPVARLKIPRAGGMML